METKVMYCIIAYLSIGVICAIIFSRRYNDFKFQPDSIFRMGMAVVLWPFLIIMELNDTSP